VRRRFRADRPPSGTGGPGGPGGAALEVTGVAKSFGSLTVLRGVSVRIGPGEAVGIVGPNGAGKTTLLDVVAGTRRADAGRVVLNGRDVTRLAPPLRARMGLGRTFQVPRPLDQLTVFENALVAAIRAGGRHGPEAYQAGYQALELAGILPHANRPAGSLRLLDRKRLELARALAMRPRVLLLDEIAGGLTDPETEALIGTIRRVVADGTTVVWVEHVIRALVQIATRLVCLADGEVIADAPPAEALASSEVRAAYLGGGVL
jgi:branched-chain amino acid transport system ATP-binding protein